MTHESLVLPDPATERKISTSKGWDQIGVGLTDSVEPENRERWSNFPMAEVLVVQ
jgi:hypothetical protein